MGPRGGLFAANADFTNLSERIRERKPEDTLQVLYLTTRITKK